MSFATDWTITPNGAALDVRHTSGTANFTVLDLHRELQAFADDQEASGDDILDISTLTPSDRSTDNIVTLLNGCNIDDASAVFLYDGSVTQDAGDTIYAGLVVVGAVEVGTAIIIVQDNAVVTDTWTAAPNADAGANILMRKVLKTRENGVDIDRQKIVVEAREYFDTYAEFSVTMALGNNVAALFTSADGNNTTAQATVQAYDKWDNVLEGYQLLDITAVGSQEPFYSQWQLTGTGTLPAVPVINDLYEQAKSQQRRGTAETLYGLSGALFRGITHEVDYDGELGTGPVDLDTLAWGTFIDIGAITVSTFNVGEVVTGGTSGAVGRLLSVDTTAESLVVDTESGTWANGESITGTGTATATIASLPTAVVGGGVGQVLAALDGGTTGSVWIQLLKGTAPIENSIMYEDGAALHANTIVATAAITARTISTPFIGSSTGSALLGAYGIGMDPADTTSSDLFVDLDGTSRTPPNNVTFDVGGLIVAEDQVLVGPETGGGGDLDLGQFALSTALVLATGTAIVFKVGTETPGTGSLSETDTPATGTIRVQGDDGIYYRIPYTAVVHGSGIMTFTVLAIDVPAAAVDQQCFISYIDVLAASVTESFTAVYSGTPRDLFVRVRDGKATPIKTFETPATLGASGGSATAIRTSDL